jgi:hypothetical protein
LVDGLVAVVGGVGLLQADRQTTAARRRRAKLFMIPGL